MNQGLNPLFPVSKNIWHDVPVEEEPEDSKLGSDKLETSSSHSIKRCEFALNGNGVLWCGRCCQEPIYRSLERQTENWCDHKSQFVIDRQDAKLIWNIFDQMSSGTGLNGYFLHVPVHPVLNQNVWVRLEDVDKEQWLGFYKAIITHPDLPDRNYPFALEDAFLGFLHVGEGLFVLRKLVLNWMTKYAPSHLPLKCPAKSHGFKQQQTFLANIKSNEGRFTETWSLFWNRRCYTCYSLLTSASSLDNTDKSDYEF